MATPSTAWRKLIWTWNPSGAREAGDSIVRNFLLHWFPSKVSRPSLSWSYSFWLGTVSAVLFLILVLSGMVLMFLYVPSVERAYLSVKDLEFVITFGWFLRGVHRIAAHLMVAVVFLHMVRVFLTGAYKNGTAALQNRPLNWVVGVVLLLGTLLLSFTGYLLPWDQLAYWATTVGTNIASAAPLVGDRIRFLLLGGTTIEQSALIRFYVLHCFFLPTLVLLLFSYHVWRIRKDGGLACVDQLSLKQKAEPAPLGKTKTYSLLGITGGTTVHAQTALLDEESWTLRSSPWLTRRLATVITLTLALTIILTLIFPAPLEAPANPAETPNPAKAPWYFLWLQELVTDTTVHLGSWTLNGALIGGIILPGILLLWLLAWPYLDRTPVHAAGVWWARTRRRQNLVFLLVVLVVIVLTLIGTFMRGPYWDFYWPWQQWPEPPHRF